MSNDSVPTTDDETTRAELIETADILADPDAMAAIAEGEAELAQRPPGRRITFTNLLGIVDDLAWAAHQEAQDGHHVDAARLMSYASAIKTMAHSPASTR